MNRYGQMLLALGILLLGTAAWAKATVGSVQQDEDTSSASEVWGGEDVRLVLSAQGATVEFDCAEGKLLQPIKAASNGEFTARGIYTPGQFGPIRKDNPPREMPAIYKGTISDDTMHLQVILEDKKIQPPPFTLTKGKSGHVVRCH
jgi:hypothetical protein